MPTTNQNEVSVRGNDNNLENVQQAITSAHQPQYVDNRISQDGDNPLLMKDVHNSKAGIFVFGAGTACYILIFLVIIIMAFILHFTNPFSVNVLSLVRNQLSQMFLSLGKSVAGGNTNDDTEKNEL